MMAAAGPGEEPIKIVGVITAEVKLPKFNGTSMSGFCRVPLKLSRVATPEWESLFERNWNHSPRFAALRRASIASVNGDRITLSLTTVEEVLQEHRMMLVECVTETNRQLAERDEAARAREQEFRQRQEAHRRRIQELADQNPF